MHARAWLTTLGLLAGVLGGCDDAPAAAPRVNVRVSRGSCDCAPTEYQLRVLERRAGGELCLLAAATTRASDYVLRDVSILPGQAITVALHAYCGDGTQISCDATVNVQATDGETIALVLANSTGPPAGFDASGCTGGIDAGIDAGPALDAARPDASVRQVFDDNGTFTMPAGASTVTIRAWGGGGGGGAGLLQPGGSGGGGGYAEQTVALAATAQLQIAVGQGGVGGPCGGGPGGGGFAGGAGGMATSGGPGAGAGAGGTGGAAAFGTSSGGNGGYGGGGGGGFSQATSLGGGGGGGASVVRSGGDLLLVAGGGGGGGAAGSQVGGAGGAGCGRSGQGGFAFAGGGGGGGGACVGALSTPGQGVRPGNDSAAQGAGQGGSPGPPDPQGLLTPDCPLLRGGGGRVIVEAL